MKALKQKSIKNMVLAVVLAAVFSVSACSGTKTSQGTDSLTKSKTSMEQNTNSKQTGSSGADKNGEKVTLHFWTFHTNAEREFMESLGKRYAAVNPNIEVVYESIPESDYMSTKLTTAFAAGEGPDVFVMSPGDFLKYANSGVAKDLTPYFTKEMLDDFLPSSIDAVKVDNKILAVPFEVELLGLYYRKDMFESAGLTPPKTWEELKKCTKELTTDEVSGLTIEPSKGYYQNFAWYPFLWQTGANVLNAETKTATFKGDGVEKALQLWHDLVEAGAPTKLSIPLSTDITPLGNGETAMQECGTWAIAAIESQYPDSQIGLTPLPVPEGGKAATCAGGWKMMVNNNSKYAEEAAKFVMWAFAENTDIPLEWCTKVKFAYSPRKSVVEAGKDIYGKGLRKIFTEEIYDSAIGEPRYPAEIVNAVGDALQNVMLAGGNPKEEAEKANRKIEEFLKKFNGGM